MKKVTIENDIRVFYVTAVSFPEGIPAAIAQLHSLFPFSSKRRIFGLSRPENGGTIVYRAAAEEMEEGEATKFACETLLIKKGKYVSITVNEFRKDPLAIARAFERLLTQPNLDSQGYCVELYASDEESVICMIRLNE